MQLMSPVTPRAAQHRGIREAQPRSTRGAPGRGARGAREAGGDGDGDWLGRGSRTGAVARRAARAQRSWVAAGCWCWSRRRESPPPRWHQAPRPHLDGFFPGPGAAASPPPPPACHRRLGPPSPTCGSALRHLSLSSLNSGEGRGPGDPTSSGRRDPMGHAPALGAQLGHSGPPFGGPPTCQGRK